MLRIVVCVGVILLSMPWGATQTLEAQTNPMRAPKTFPRRHQSRPPSPAVSMPVVVFDQMLRFYQKIISQVDGARSKMYPTGSAYARQVINKHGGLLGIILTTERLLHEGNEGLVSPRIRKYGVWRIFDPVEANDWWWHDPDWVYIPSSGGVRIRY